MSIELRIPSAGESIQEVQIGQWLKHEGDRVRRDETVVELDTDKASMELPSSQSTSINSMVLLVTGSNCFGRIALRRGISARCPHLRARSSKK